MLAPTSSGAKRGSGRPSFCRVGRPSPITPFRAGEPIPRRLAAGGTCSDSDPASPPCAGIGIPSRLSLPEPYMFHKPNDIRLHIAERSRDIPALLRYRIQPSNHLRYVIGAIGEMAAPALKEGRGTLIGRLVGLGGFGFLRAGRLLKGAQPQWAQRSSGLYGHPGMPAMRSISA